MKLDDVPFIVRKMENEMPIHTPKTAQVPSSFVRELPKNLMDYSAKVDNKFLNNHLHEILEFYHCFPEYHSKQFEKYHVATYGKNYDILNHDGCFKGFGLHNKTKYSQIMIDPYKFVSGGGGGCDAGSELETNGGASGSATLSSNKIHTAQVSSTSGKCYNEIAWAFSIFYSGSAKAGIYDDTSATPDNLLGQCNAYSVSSGYVYQPLTAEVTLTTSLTWLACLKSANSPCQHDTSITDQPYKSRTYSLGFIDPFGTETYHVTSFRGKIGHS